MYSAPASIMHQKRLVPSAKSMKQSTWLVLGSFPSTQSALHSLQTVSSVGSQGSTLKEVAARQMGSGKFDSFVHCYGKNIMLGLAYDTV
jgi:hypothetical protein